MTAKEKEEARSYSQLQSCQEADLCDSQMQIWRISELGKLMDHYYVSLTPSA